MDLLLRKDVQKASYYVWFLGAEESRALRGSRTLLSAIPYVVDRSQEVEPIKVTLQVSHKGMKIVQGSSKHFITHSAITCSVQTDDIVACILLLYNPITKCPLHIHVYRCDSETTAQALNQQLQVLINRPENQKRFAELETRLGLTNSSPNARKSLPPVPSPSKQIVKEMKKPLHRSSDERQSHAPVNGKRFDSSLGSDTGTSTRESDEGSEERTSLDLSPTQPSIFDSLAAELREKLNGNGPPLLLPPRDYDTMHRSKGNLAAIELRRCRNKLIVGQTTKQGVSSRGSSGIGSDLAPSPERQEAQSSSDDDWLLKKRELESKLNLTSLRRTSGEKSSNAGNQRIEKPPSYLYPLQKPAYIIPTTKSSKSSDLYAESDTDANDSPPTPPKEEEIKPKLVRPRNLEAQFKQILSEKQFDEKDIDEDQQFSNEERFFKNDSVKYVTERSLDKKKLAANGSANGNANPNANGNMKQVHRTKSVPTAKDVEESDEAYRYRYRGSKNGTGHSSNEKLKMKSRESFDVDDDFEYNENLTDKQKYHQSLLMKKQLTNTHSMPREREYFDDGFRAKRSVSPPLPRRNDVKSASMHRNEQLIKPGRPYYDIEERERERERERTIDSKKFRNKSSTKHYDEIDFERNPYKEPVSAAYRENIDCMIKSPVMRYKSYDEEECRDEDCTEECFSDCDKEFAHPPQSSYPSKYRHGMYERNEQNPVGNRQRYREKRISPDIDAHSAKESFHHSKDKFKQMERQRSYGIDDEIERQPYPIEKQSQSHAQAHLRRMVPMPMRQMEPFEANSSHSNGRHPVMGRQSSAIDWSSDEDQFGGRGQSPPSNVRIIPREREHFEKNPVGRAMGPSKSLGNLVKGYRHSYAEPPPPPLPRNPMPRNSGRVGLAAVNPY